MIAVASLTSYHNVLAGVYSTDTEEEKLYK